MRKTLIARIKDFEQYDEQKNLVHWKDPTLIRWNSVYNKLKPTDRAIFILAGLGKVLLTRIKEIHSNESILCDKVESFSLGNDQFLRLNAIFGEKASRIKANFRPFLFDHDISLVDFRRQARNEELVNFYVVRSEVEYRKRHLQFSIFDRIVILNGSRVEKIVLHKADHSAALAFQKIQPGAIGKTLPDLIHIHENGRKEKTNLIRQLHQISTEVQETGVYKFRSFFMYYDIFFNKRAYQGPSRARDGDRVPLEEKIQLKAKDEADIKAMQKAASKVSTRRHNQMTNRLRELFDSARLFEGKKRVMFDVQLARFDGVNNLLIEVKSSTERAHTRMAIGQLLDYCFSLGKKADRRFLSVLLPSKPDAQTRALLEWCKIGLLWFESQQLVTSTEWLKCIAKYRIK